MPLPGVTTRRQVSELGGTGRFSSVRLYILFYADNKEEGNVTITYKHITYITQTFCAARPTQTSFQVIPFPRDGQAMYQG